MGISPLELTGHHRQAGFVARRSDGPILIKIYDKAYRRLVVGKWVLYDAQGTCLGHRRFYDDPQAPPPYQWANERLQDGQYLRRVGF